MSVFRKFFKVNRNLAWRIEPYLPQAKTDVQTMKGMYEAEVVHRMNSRPTQVVVDVGGGRSCTFAGLRDPAMRTRIIAVDVSEKELRHNCDADEKRVADITQGLPFGPGEVDLIVSSFVLEHVKDLGAFVSDSKRILKTGGYSVHLLPSKFALFALINQALPKAVSSKLVSYIYRPGFPAYYDNCYYSAIKALLEKHDFEVAKIHLSYYQSRYFAFFLPLFVASVLYEVPLYLLGAKNPCAYLLVVARKR